MRVFQSGQLPLGTVAAALLFLVAGPVLAQQAVVTGRVTSEGGDPLGGASITVVGTNLGAATAANGTYTLTVAAEFVRGQPVSLTARRIGFKPITRPVTLQAGNQVVDFQLQTDPLRLEEVVVTGVGEATARNKLTFTVGKVGAEELQMVPGSSALVALQGKVAGVRMIPTSAQPGGEVSVRLRGATSISGRQDPLYIVDGVITSFGLADIAPEDVERVEVIKGAAASSLYGSNAANGVVQVFTKRGKALPDGTLRITTPGGGRHQQHAEANGVLAISRLGARLARRYLQVARHDLYGRRCWRVLPERSWWPGRGDGPDRRQSVQGLSQPLG